MKQSRANRVLDENEFRHAQHHRMHSLTRRPLSSLSRLTCECVSVCDDCNLQLQPKNFLHRHERSAIVCSRCTRARLVYFDLNTSGPLFSVSQRVAEPSNTHVTCEGAVIYNSWIDFTNSTKWKWMKDRKKKKDEKKQKIILFVRSVRARARAPHNASQSHRRRRRRASVGEREGKYFKLCFLRLLSFWENENDDGRQAGGQA